MSSQEFVAIFWDYENCQPASGSSGYTVADYIRRIALQFGVVTVFKAYLELGKTGPSKVKTLLSELQSSGVSLIDCPHNGCKEVADKMLLVDVMAHAIDHPAPGTIILISGDRDFVYAVSTLRLRRYQVVVIASSQIHISLHRQASLVYAWNGGRADSMQTTMLRVCEESGSQNDSLFDRDSHFFSFPSTSRSPFQKDGQGRASHASPSTLTHASITTDYGSERCLVKEVVSRPVEAPVSLVDASEHKSSLSGVCHTLEGGSTQGTPALPMDLAPSPSTTGSSWRGQQKVVDHLPTSTTGALGSVASHDDATVSTRMPVHKQTATQSPTGAEPQPRTSSSSAGTSASSESFRLVGRRIIRNMKRRERVVVWRRRLARSTGNTSNISDLNTSRTEEFVVTNQRSTKHNMWNKCSVTLISLLTFKHDIYTGSISSSPVSSNSPAFTAASVPSTVTNSPLTSVKLEDDAVNKSAVMGMLAAHETSVASHPVTDHNVVTPSEAEELLHSPVRSTDIVSSSSYSETKPSQCSADDDDIDVASVAAVTCMSESTLSRTLTTASTPANTLTAVAKDEGASTTVNSVENSSSLQARAVVLSEPVLSPAPSNAAIVTNLSGPSLPMVQSVTTPAVIRSRSKFVVLVEELRCLHHQGQNRPRRSVVADGVIRRDPLIYQRAGVSSATKFDTYISLAVQAGIVTVGGKKQKWISLNPAWLSPPAVPNDATSVVSTHASALITSPNAADSLLGTSSVLTRNVPPEFVLLVERLKRLESKDVSQPFRSLVAADLLFEDRAVYQKAGVNNFDAYATLAVKAGLVTLGGEGLRTWISLKA